jgi:uncharacterized protein with von Willebrand factor type A (vWA) domain
MPPRPLLFAAQEARLEGLERLARQHRLSGSVHSQGAIEPRLAGLVDLRGKLFAGAVPPASEWPWPAAPIATPLALAMGELSLARYCKGRQELTDSVLTSLLFHLDAVVDYLDHGAAGGDAAAMAVAAFRAEWAERCGQMAELMEVFDSLPDADGRIDWGLLRGVLHSSGWQAVLRTRRRLEQLPELERLIRRLGRSRPSDEEDRTREEAVTASTAGVGLASRTRDLRIPDMPGETRGVRRSDRIARMLPSEAVLMRHPGLRLVWHARRAERALLTYEDDERVRETLFRPVELALPAPRPGPGKRLEAGPMLVCVDTSGSMQGGAEAVAKAVVLAAMRTAHRQGRACHLFAFSGPEEVLEMELSMTTAGLLRLTELLGQAFHGGTDIGDPLDRVLTKLEGRRWRRADLLIASDGEFGATPELAGRIAGAKRVLGLRVQGVLVGDRETVGFLQLADDILHVRDWRRYAAQHGKAADAPISDPGITARLFPGALHSQASQDASVVAKAVAHRRKP